MNDTVKKIKKIPTDRPKISNFPLEGNITSSFFCLTLPYFRSPTTQVNTGEIYTWQPDTSKSNNVIKENMYSSTKKKKLVVFIS